MRATHPRAYMHEIKCVERSALNSLMRELGLPVLTAAAQNFTQRILPFSLRVESY